MVLLDWDDTLMPTTYLVQHIEQDIDARTKELRSFRIKDPSKSREVLSNLNAAGSAALDLLKKLYSFDKVKRSNIKIVTNGAMGWLWNSLTITGTLCPIYREIKQLLLRQSTEIIYARNTSLNHNYWKLVSFDHILGHYLDRNRCGRLNLITIGDQWTDHCSVELSAAFQRHHSAISHHQIKLFEAADCRYLGVELKYITNLLDQPVLFEFVSPKTDGVVLEFEGYTHSDDSIPGEDSL